MVFSGSWRGWRDLNQYFDPDYILGEIIKDLDHSKKIVDAPTGDLPVFVHPDGLNMFLWPVMQGVNGRNVAKGESPLKGRLGEQILDPAITIIDDPHLDFDNGAFSIDDYGIPTRDITIIRNGVLENFLYDYDTAGMAGAEPTGNNGCRPYSSTVPAGARSKDELLAGIKDGLIVRQVLGFGQSNIINGDFASNVGLGFRVKDGKVVGRVKDVMIAGNIYDILKSGVELSRETDPIARMPYAVISGVSVSA
jgi:PmbA protein